MKPRPRLIAFKGIPACGKSFRAKQMLQENPDWVHVERDLIRDELGMDRNKFDPDKEKLVTETASDRILKALKAGKTVVNSDTNLNYKTQRHLVSLAEQGKADLEWVDFTNVPLELCIERDAKRKHSVGEAVIRKFYARIQPDLPVLEEKVIVLGGSA